MLFRSEVLALFVGSVGEIHGVAELTTEFVRTSPVNNTGQGTNKENTDDSADQQNAGNVPFGFFHFYTLYVVLVRQTGVCIWVVCLPNNEDEDYVNGKPRIGSNIDRVQPMKVDVDG